MTTTLSQWEVGPFNEGMNVSMLPTEIDDNEGAIVQDFLLDKPGIIYSRGTITNVVQTASTLNGTGRVFKGLFSTNSPDGATHLASVTQDNSSTNTYFEVLSDTGNAPGIKITLDSAHPLTSDLIVDAKPALGGGLWIGTQELNATPNVAGRQCLFHWRGATKANYGTGTIACTAGSAVITGTGTAWLANAAPGMFLLDSAGGFNLGVVKTVDSNTQITLETGASFATASTFTYVLSSIRGFGCLESSKGRISITAGSNSVIGSGTKFLSQNFFSPSGWVLFRAKDNAWIGGAVTSILGDEGLTLFANATFSMDDEPYVARSIGLGNYLDYKIPKTLALSSGAFPGVFNTTYAGLQWFARQDGPTAAGTGDMNSRVWFSDYRNQNSLDLLTQDGDYVQVPSTVGRNRPITGIAATTNALLIFKENETFAITGDSPDTFALNKIWDDGCLCSMSIVQYRGAIIWAGANGIYIFDGKDVTNLVARSLGPAWTTYISPFDTRIHRMAAGVYKDHYFLSVNSSAGSGNNPYSILKNGTGFNPGRISYVINILTKALSVFSNLNVLGTAAIVGKTLYAQQDTYVCDFQALFNGAGTKDYPGTFAAPYYPDPVFESKWFSMKDPLLKKMFKQVLGTFENLRNPLWLEVAPGLGDSGLSSSWSVLTGQFPTNSSNPFAARLKFLKRERFIRVKFYQTTLQNVTAGQYSIRKFAIGFKSQKIGRI